MEERSKVHVGLDVHKDSISVASAAPGRGPATVVGKVAHDVGKLVKVLARLGEAGDLHLVYEAGPTGYGLQRALSSRGYHCEVIAPSQMPRRPGDRVKTDGRDCVQLAECSRAGQLRAVWVPEPADESIRDLARAREDAVNARTQARLQLKSFLLRHDVRYTGKTAWCGAHERWLAQVDVLERFKEDRNLLLTDRHAQRLDLGACLRLLTFAGGHAGHLHRCDGGQGGAAGGGVCAGEGAGVRAQAGYVGGAVWR